jgi:hypothetical protein
MPSASGYHSSSNTRAHDARLERAWRGRAPVPSRGGLEVFGVRPGRMDFTCCANTFTTASHLSSDRIHTAKHWEHPVDSGGHHGSGRPWPNLVLGRESDGVARRSISAGMSTRAWRVGGGRFAGLGLSCPLGWELDAREVCPVGPG